MEDFIEIYDDALSSDQCRQIIDQFEGNNAAYQGHAGPGVDLTIKDSMDLNITRRSDWVATNEIITDAVFKCLVKYMHKYSFMLVGANIPLFKHPETGEVSKLRHENFAEFGAPHIPALTARTYRLGELNVQKYINNEGGYHHWHSEVCADSDDCESLHRALFFILYLNDIDSGGETEFYYQKKKVAPKTGRIVFSPAGFTHTHKGNIPASGDKYVVTSWILFNRFES